MKCPTCGYKLNAEANCPICGVNVYAKRKTLNMSVSLYNKALEQVKISDFSGAQSSLIKCVCLDKTNIEARNLLGLVYYETGRIADALKQWIISAGFKPEKNKANDYMAIYQKEARTSEMLEDCIKLYNEALVFIKQQSFDMAIIRLKKATETNAKFVDALNLLALCYMKEKKNSSALEAVNAVLKHDIYNPTALSYFRILCPDKARPDMKRKVEPKDQEANPGMISLGGKAVKQNNSGVGSVIGFIVGAVVVALVAFVLILPASIGAKNDEIDNLEKNLAELQANYEELQTKSNEITEELQKENDSLKAANAEYSTKVDLQSRIEAVQKAQEYYSQGNAVDAAKLVINLDTTDFTDDLLKQFNDIKAKSIPDAADSLYNLGKAAYDKKNLEEAKGYLTQCITFAADSPSVKYNAIYQLGRIALDEGDKEKAKEYLTEVVNNHPSDTYKGNAQHFLDKANEE